MGWNPLPIEGAWQVKPETFADARGSFRELFTQTEFEAATGHPFHLAQANTSISRAGVVRGIHFAPTWPSQAKYVTCLRGAIIDYVVDLRVGSPTFGKFTSVTLEANEPGGVYISEGLGHAFIALADDTTVTYLCSTVYAPQREFGIVPTDPQIGIDWPKWTQAGEKLEMILSEKDAAAPTLAAAREQGLLPDYAEFIAQRRNG